jgi:hypothetical protein
VSAICLVPILALWQALAGPKLKWKRYALVLTVGALTAFVFWPWLWADPVGRLKWAATHIGSRFHIDSVKVLYFGRIYEAWELPWHYSLVHVLAATPILYLLCAAAALRPDRSGLERGAPAPRSAAILGWLWCAIPIAAEMRAPMHYDGARHLLMTAPGLCLLAGVGLDSVLRFEQRPPTRARRLVIATMFGAAAIAYAGAQLIRVHPYHNAYLNEVVRAWLPGNAEDMLEVEYWGQSHKEGAEWLKAHAEADADIYVGLDTASADHYLGRRSRKMNTESLRTFEDRTRPAYFMVITRKAMYSPAIEHIVKTYEPILVIRRQKGNLLKIFSNRRPLQGG